MLVWGIGRENYHFCQSSPHCTNTRISERHGTDQFCNCTEAKCIAFKNKTKYSALVDIIFPVLLGTRRANGTAKIYWEYNDDNLQGFMDWNNIQPSSANLTENCVMFRCNKYYLDNWGNHHIFICEFWRQTFIFLWNVKYITCFFFLLTMMIKFCAIVILLLKSPFQLMQITFVKK